MKILKVLLIVIVMTIDCFSDETVLIDKNLNNQFITITTNSYKVLEFPQRIKNIKISDSKKIKVEFVDKNYEPLSVIKVFATDLGNAYALITFIDGSTIQVNFNIVNDLKSIINMIENDYKGVKVSQIAENIVLNGNVDSTKDRRKIVEILQKAKVDVENSLIDNLKVERPENMIRIKLYAVEINNTKGLTLKNNWVLSSKNYTSITNEDGTYYNVPSNSMDTSNAQRNNDMETSLNSIVNNAVTLTGGLTGVANYLGKYFNVGLTLNYLSEEGVARILDETTLITTEGNEANFLAGGYITVKTSTTSAQGVPVTELKQINYGLKLKFDVSEIINNQYVSLKITTEQSDADWTNTVEDIPSITTKSVETNVIALNQSTIILGGLIQKNQSKSISKIPLLGDIPVLGRLFRSEDFQNGHSELAFFVTPEIVITHSNNQVDDLSRVKSDIKSLDKKYDDNNENVTTKSN